MYAIIETGGKQFKVAAGDVIQVEKLELEAGASFTFDKVLMVGGSGDVKVGSPYVAGVTVSATVNKQDKHKKVIVYKYKPKKGFRKKRGHRQPFTELTINTIN